MADTLFAPGFKTDPYWWDAAPRPKEQAKEPIPTQADVVIVGSGYTGTSAALTLVRNGRKALVLEAEEIGRAHV